MKANLVSDGDAGILPLPTALLKQLGIKNSVEMEVRGSELILRAARKPPEARSSSKKRNGAGSHSA
jgi:antitoxin component of MazEF toxin-antitoxin module